MVRLKAGANGIVEVTDYLFQFQNGAIKRLVGSHNKDGQIEFQFQNGAIKRHDSRIFPASWNSFQFQNGAIKR